MFDQNVLAMFGIIASMFVLYLLIWLFWLRLQVKSIGTPVYRGTPPDRFSPASARYLFKKEYDNVAFVCAIASAGTKGYLSAKCLGKKFLFLKNIDPPQVIYGRLAGRMIIEKRI